MSVAIRSRKAQRCPSCGTKNPADADRCQICTRTLPHEGYGMQAEFEAAFLAMLVGAPNMVAYAATKAFDTVMTEALWTELHPHGVDVLGLVLGATDTPAFRQLMLQRGLISSLDQVPAVPGLSSIDAVTERLLANLGNGPTVFADDLLAAGAQYFGAMPRNEAVRTMMQHAAATMGPTD